jgi:enterochelin esterase family protein
MTTAATMSRRIEALIDRVRAGDSHAEASFWAGVEAGGTPLIEPLDGDAAHSLVTFLWRGSEETRQVLLLSAVADDQVSALERVPGTAVWHGSWRVSNDVRSGYQFIVDQDVPDDSAGRFARIGEIAASGGIIPDPMNSRQVSFDRPDLTPISTLELPGAPAQPWLAFDPQAPAGRIDPHRFESAALGNTRVIWTYLPPAYAETDTTYPLLVLYDGFGYLKTGIATTLDNLIAQRRIRPIVVAMVHQLDRMQELTGDEQFASCIARELAREWLPAHYRISDDPALTAIGGVSAGGYGAGFAALRHPDVFGNVLSQSGSFFWGPGASLPLDTQSPGVAWDWLIRQFGESPRLRLRWYLDVGTLETPRTTHMPNMLASNRRMRDALTQKGYDVSYREFAGGHDYACWRGTVADGLEWLFPATR